MMKTTEARTAFGMYDSGPVRNSRTTTTIAAAVSCEIWVRPPALSTISVFVGLPLTTNVPVMPAAAFATPSPIEVDVLLEAVRVLHRVGPGRRGALGEDDDDERDDGRQERLRCSRPS